jgi:hypothetical protein
MKGPLIESLAIPLRGVMPLERLAGQIVVEIELRYWKVKLGYVGEGSWQQYRGEDRPTWVEICDKQAGITERTEASLHQCGEAVKARLAKKGTSEAREILDLIESAPPSELSTDDRKRLVDGIRRLALVEGDSQRILRQEYLDQHGKAGEKPGESDTETPAVVVVDFRSLPHMFGAMNPSKDYTPAERRKHLISLGLYTGLEPKRAKELAIIMTPDDELPEDERRRKLEMKSMVSAFCAKHRKHS